MRRLSVQELKRLREEKFEYYRQIKRIILPESFSNIKVFIGGCIERGVGSSLIATAHAHNYKNHSYYSDDPHFGTICFRSIKHIGKYHEVMCDDGIEIIVDKPSQTVLHEIAHVYAPNQYHTKKWLNEYIKIGASKGQIEKAKRRWKTCR